MNLSEQLDPENRNISKNKEEKKKKNHPPKKKYRRKKCIKKLQKTPKNQYEKNLRKRRFICYKAKVLKYYNECSKTNATRNKQIPKSRSLKYKHMY